MSLNSFHIFLVNVERTDCNVRMLLHFSAFPIYAGFVLHFSS